MGLIIGIIALIIWLILIGNLRESALGQVFLFVIFMVIMCSIFGDFIPFGT